MADKAQASAAAVWDTAIVETIADIKRMSPGEQTELHRVAAGYTRDLPMPFWRLLVRFTENDGTVAQDIVRGYPPITRTLSAIICGVASVVREAHEALSAVNPGEALAASGYSRACFERFLAAKDELDADRELRNIASWLSSKKVATDWRELSRFVIGIADPRTKDSFHWEQTLNKMALEFANQERRA